MDGMAQHTLGNGDVVITYVKDIDEIYYTLLLDPDHFFLKSIEKR